MDGLVPLTIMIKTVFFRFKEYKVVSDQLRALYPRLVLDDIENFVVGKHQRSGVFFHLEGLGRFGEKTGNTCLL